MSGKILFKNNGQKVQIAGDFNQWKKEQMTLNDAKNVYEYTVKGEPDKSYSYKFLLGTSDTWVLANDQPKTMDDAGNENHSITLSKQHPGSSRSDVAHILDDAMEETVGFRDTHQEDHIPKPENAHEPKDLGVEVINKKVRANHYDPESGPQRHRSRGRKHSNASQSSGQSSQARGHSQSGIHSHLDPAAPEFSPILTHSRNPSVTSTGRQSDAHHDDHLNPAAPEFKPQFDLPAVPHVLPPPGPVSYAGALKLAPSPPPSVVEHAAEHRSPDHHDATSQAHPQQHQIAKHEEPAGPHPVDVEELKAHLPVISYAAVAKHEATTHPEPHIHERAQETLVNHLSANTHPATESSDENIPGSKTPAKQDKGSKIPVASSDKSAKEQEMQHRQKLQPSHAHIPEEQVAKAISQGKDPILSAAVLHSGAHDVASLIGDGHALAAERREEALAKKALDKAIQEAEFGPWKGTDETIRGAIATEKRVVNVPQETARQTRQIAKDIVDDARPKVQAALEAADEVAIDARIKAVEIKAEIEEKAADIKGEVKEKAVLTRELAAEATEEVKAKASKVRDQVVFEAYVAKELATEAKDEVKNKAKEVGEAVAQKTGEIKQDAKQKAAVAKELAKEAQDAIAEKAADVRDDVEKKVSEVKDEISEVASEVRDKAVELKEEVTEKTAEIKDELKVITTEAKDKAIEIKEAINEKASEIKGEVKDVAEDFKEGVKEAAENVKREANEVAAEVRDAAIKVKESVKDKAAKVEERVEEAAERTLQEAKAVQKEVAETAREVKAAVKDKAVKVEATVEKIGTDFAKAVEKTAAESKANVKHAAHTIGEQVERIEAKVEPYVADFANAVERTAAESKANVKRAVSELEGKAIETELQVEETAKRAAAKAREIGEETAEFTRELKDEIVGKVGEDLEQVKVIARNAKESVEETAAPYVEKVRETADSVMTEIVEDASIVQRMAKELAGEVVHVAEEISVRLSRGTPILEDAILSTGQVAKDTVETVLLKADDVMTDVKDALLINEPLAVHRTRVALEQTPLLESVFGAAKDIFVAAGHAVGFGQPFAERKADLEALAAAQERATGGAARRLKGTDQAQVRQAAEARQAQSRVDTLELVLENASRGLDSDDLLEAELQSTFPETQEDQVSKQRPRSSDPVLELSPSAERRVAEQSRPANDEILGTHDRGSGNVGVPRRNSLLHFFNALFGGWARLFRSLAFWRRPT